MKLIEGTWLTVAAVTAETRRCFLTPDLVVKLVFRRCGFGAGRIWRLVNIVQCRHEYSVCKENITVRI
jgi:hypothetical protein